MPVIGRSGCAGRAGELSCCLLGFGLCAQGFYWLPGLLLLGWFLSAISKSIPGCSTLLLWRKKTLHPSMPLATL